MLFPDPTRVNEVWELVARATARNELGIAAKVAPRDPGTPPEKDRLICIYTADFRDKADIGRVLERMRQLGLVQSTGRLIYYKCGGSSIMPLLNLLIGSRCLHILGNRLRKPLGDSSLPLQLSRDIHILETG
jgi:hypothetical protein